MIVQRLATTQPERDPELLPGVPICL